MTNFNAKGTNSYVLKITDWKSLLQSKKDLKSLVKEHMSHLVQMTGPYLSCQKVMLDIFKKVAKNN